MDTIKVCSFNLRMETSHDQKNMFTYRTPYIKEAIRREKPDIIGFQEVLPNMLDWLHKTFDEYVVVGCGRGADYKNEANPVLFKKGAFDFLGYDMFWLSPTPFVPGSRYEEQSDCPRICVVVTLKKSDSNKPFRFYNTHLDHVSDTARKQGITAILKHMDEDSKRMELPHILMGDLNAFPDSETIRFINECPTRKFTELTSEVCGTYHGYGTTSGKIDYIFVSGNASGGNAKKWTDCHDGVYLSDHYPVSADVNI